MFRGNSNQVGPRSASRLPPAAQIDTVLFDSEGRHGGLMIFCMDFLSSGLRGSRMT